jgi:hypothetical protein
LASVGTEQELTVCRDLRTNAEATGIAGEIRWDPTVRNGQPQQAGDTGRSEKLPLLRGQEATVRRDPADGRVVRGDVGRSRAVFGTEVGVSREEARLARYLVVSGW